MHSPAQAVDGKTEEKNGKGKFGLKVDFKVFWMFVTRPHSGRFLVTGLAAPIKFMTADI